MSRRWTATRERHVAQVLAGRTKAPYADKMLSQSAARAEAYRELVAGVYELAAVARRVREPLALEAGLTGAQSLTLSVLTQVEATVPMIADELGVTRQAIQRVVDELVVTHLVERRDNPSHSRSPLHRITPEGQRRLDRLVEDELAVGAEATARVTVEQVQDAHAVLRSVIDGLRVAADS